MEGCVGPPRAPSPLSPLLGLFLAEYAGFSPLSLLNATSLSVCLAASQSRYPQKCADKLQVSKI